MPDVDVDTLDYPTTGTLPIGVPGGERHGGARTRQQPRLDLRGAGAADSVAGGNDQPAES